MTGDTGRRAVLDWHEAPSLPGYAGRSTCSARSSGSWAASD